MCNGEELGIVNQKRDIDLHPHIIHQKGHGLFIENNMIYM